LDFGKRLKELREGKGITQEELAEHLGVGRPTIAGYETKGKQPDFEKLSKIADFFNCSIDYLLGRTNERKFTSGPIAAHHEGLMGEDLSDLEDIISEAVKKAAKWREEREKKERGDS